MRYLTDRKRALGLGAAKTGTEHHWSMMVSSVALLLLIPPFVLILGRVLGAPHDEVVATFSRPFPAIVTVLTLWVGMEHFRRGVQVLIEDYTPSLTRKLLVIATTCLSYALIAAGVYAIVRMAI